MHFTVVVISFEDAVANHRDEGIPREDITETTDLAVTVSFQKASSVGSGNSRSILVCRLLKSGTVDDSRVVDGSRSIPGLCCTCCLPTFVVVCHELVIVCSNASKLIKPPLLQELPARMERLITRQEVVLRLRGLSTVRDTLAFHRCHMELCRWSCLLQVLAEVGERNLPSSPRGH